jgi:allantoinase
VSNALFDYSPIVDRLPLQWPNGARIAFWLGLNIEYFELDRPSTSIFTGTAELSPDPLNWGWRDYGTRVGVWRMMEVCDQLGIPVSAIVNSDATVHYDRLVEAGNERNWAWVAHGRSNSEFHVGLSQDDERVVLSKIVGDIERSTGHRPKGWLGPALTETYNTPTLLHELGLTYILDWCNDDQPYPLNVGAPPMLSVPYAIEVNDISQCVSRGVTGEGFYRMIMDQLEGLLASDLGGGQVMAVAVHPFVMGVPFRLRYLARALREIAAMNEVWLTTSDEIAAVYAADVGASQP